MYHVIQQQKTEHRREM